MRLYNNYTTISDHSTGSDPVVSHSVV